MKKFVVVLLALFLAVPAAVYAGSVTSKYDVTIGGFVKMDVGWQNQNLGPDYSAATRNSLSNNQNLLDKYGSLYWYSGETRVNLGIKGPDAWGAKTSAFIEGDFRGSSVGAAAGVFELRHAFMKFDWAQDSLLIGQYWNDWGYIPSFYIVGNGDLNPMGRGSRQPQIRWTHTWNKNFSGFAGIYSEYNTLAGGTTTVNAQNDNARSLMPHFMGEFKWQTDSWGKIGPWLTQFALGGFYGQEKKTYVNTTGGYNSDNVNSWSVALKGYIPIIPEKKGNKTGAFSFSGAAFMGQNNGLYYTSGPAASYDAALNPNAAYYSAAATFNYGGWGQLSYYFTDNLWVNGIYGTFSNSFNPNTFRAVGANAIRTNQQIFLNVFYDVNPAVRFGIEYARVMTGYAAYGPLATGATPTRNLDRSGTMDSVRAAAWYFF